MRVEISSKCSLLPPTHHFSTATENDRGDTGRGEFASSNGRKRGRGDWWRLLKRQIEYLSHPRLLFLALFALHIISLLKTQGSQLIATSRQEATR